MRRIGFFSDLPHGDAISQSLSEVVGRLSKDLADHVAEYLRAGTVILPTFGTRCFDVLSESNEDIGPLAVCSDGEWAWPSDLPFFVTKYQVDLPVAFIKHARQRGWRPPNLSEEDIVIAVDGLIKK
jgi:hypothetical protein